MRQMGGPKRPECRAGCVCGTGTRGTGCGHGQEGTGPVCGALREGRGRQRLARPRALRAAGPACRYLAASSFLITERNPAVGSACLFHVQVLVVTERLLARTWINLTRPLSDSVRVTPTSPAREPNPSRPGMEQRGFTPTCCSS